MRKRMALNAAGAAGGIAGGVAGGAGVGAIAGISLDPVGIGVSAAVNAPNIATPAIALARKTDVVYLCMISIFTIRTLLPLAYDV